MRSIRSDAGFTLIDVLFTLALIGTLSTIAMPGLFRARSRASTSAVIGSLRVINTGQLSYAITCGAGFYAPNLTTLGMPALGSTQSFLPHDLAGGNIVTKNNYRFRMEGTAMPAAPGSCNGLAVGAGTVAYRSGADSLDPAYPVHFSSNTSGAIWSGSASLYATTGDAAGPPAGTLIK